MCILYAQTRRLTAGCFVCSPNFASATPEKTMTTSTPLRMTKVPSEMEYSIDRKLVNVNFPLTFTAIHPCMGGVQLRRRSERLSPVTQYPPESMIIYLLPRSDSFLHQQ